VIAPHHAAIHSGNLNRVNYGHELCLEHAQYQAIDT